jgi:peroxiredoxin Q/BCP
VEGKGFRDGIHAFASKNLTILGVSFDTVAENRAFAEKFDFPFDLLCDTQREVGMAYGACDAPDAGHARRISYLISAHGRIAQAYNPVQPAKHPDDVLRDLEELSQPG